MSRGAASWRGLFQRAEWGLLLAIVAVFIVTERLDPLHIYSRDPAASAVDILRQTSMLGIFALGSAIVIIAGGIDLSSGSVIAFSGAVCSAVMVLLAPEEMENARSLGAGVIAAAIAAALAAGFLIGTLHAWLITVVGLPPFVATLATLVGLRSFGRVLVENVTAEMLGGKSTQIQIYDESFRYLATSVWIPAVLFALLALAMWVLLNWTVAGRHLYALGGNEEAARLSGIRTDRLKWLAYAIGAMTASLAGVLYIGDQAVADPQTLGRGYELNAIAAAVVGGCSLQGGIGTIQGVVLGVVFLRIVIDAVAKLIKTGADVYEGLIVGVLVVLAVAFNELRQRRASRRYFFAGGLGTLAGLALAMFAAIQGAILFGATSRLGTLGAGAVAGGAALLLLGTIKIWEHRSARRSHGADS